MEKHLEYSSDVITKLKEKFSNCDFSFTLLKENVNISVFFVFAKSTIFSEDDLWQKISKEIALKYQSKLENVYEKWNLYVIYLTTDLTSKELKNKIENDKFSSRKIVEDSYNEKFSNNEANRLIVKHITNSDLKHVVEKTQQVTISNYVPINENLWKLLEREEKVIGVREAQAKLIDKINLL